MLKSPLGLVRADSLHAAPVVQIVAVSALVLGIGLSGHRFNPPSAATVAAVTAPSAVEAAVRAVESSAPAQAVAKVGKAVNEVIVPPQLVTRQADVRAGESFSDVLADAGVPAAEATAAIKALAKVYSFQKLQAGETIDLTFSQTPQAETFMSAVFQPEDTKEVTVARQADGTFVASAKMLPIVRERIAARGEIRSSLFEAGDRAGVPRAIMGAMINVYAHDVDFQRDIHSGDSFEILYDQPKTVQGKTVGEGAIIYAALHVGKEIKPIYRVTFADKTVDYFDAKGRSARRSLLRTPVAAAHITSGFGMRIHPLLGYSKMHQGTDFGAPTGTPIFAAGSGVIQEIGFKNGYGRFIMIRHANGIETAYAHMSRFNSSLYRGARINQGQVIGYVGMTGRATGPHLHYEVRIAGRQVNPLSVKVPTGRVLEGAQLAQFKAGQSHIQQEFASLVGKHEPLVKVSANTRAQ